MRPATIATIALIGLSTIPALVSAAPPPRWRADGNVICRARGRQFAPVAIPDGAGGMIVTWTDERRGAGLSDVYAQRVLASGTTAPGWPTNGVKVLESTGRALITGDGAGGALLLSLQSGAIRTQHLLADGTLPPGIDPAGRVVASGIGGPSWGGFTACPDGSGGAYVMYLMFNGTSETLTLTRIDADGAPVAGWDPPIRVWAHAWEDGYTSFALTPASAGGAIVAFTTRFELPVGADYSGYARCYLGSGALAWATLLNPALGTTAAQPSPVSDGAGGAFIRISSGATNRLDAAGLPTWPISPAIVTSPYSSSDLEGGLFHTELQGQSAIVRRLDGSGALPTGWTAAGVTIASAFDIGSFDVEPLAGGLMFAWRDTPAGDIRVTLVSTAGTIGAGWSAGGNLACSVRGMQTGPTLVPLGVTAGLVAWTDERRDAGDIYANLVSVGGSIGPRAALDRGPTQEFGLELTPRLRIQTAEAAGSQLAFAGSVPESGPARIEVYDVLGRCRYRESFIAEAGAFSRRADARDLGRGVYWVRLSQGAASSVARFVRLD